MSRFFHEVQSYALYIAAGATIGAVVAYIGIGVVTFLESL